MMAACSAGGGLDRQPALSGPAGPIAPAAPEPFEVGAAQQRDLVAEGDVLRAEFRALHARGGWSERGYFTASESDVLEDLLLRERAIRAALWGRIDRLGGADVALTSEDGRSEAHLLLVHAGWALTDSGSFLVDEFGDDAVAVAKLNEPFYRADIPARTYDRLALAYTSPQHDERLAAAWQLYQTQLVDPTSALSELREGDPVAAALLTETATLHDRAAGQLRVIRARSGHGKVSEEIRHDRASELGRRTIGELGKIDYATRALLFKDVSRVKKPTAHLIRFSRAQKKQIHQLLEPGDVLLTYTAGYISDVFIPGVFKHAITYVGTPQERTSLGSLAERIPQVARPEAARVEANLAVATLADGSRADLIEAVAEGVKFSNLDHILDTHVNRIVALRPVLDAEQRAEFVAGVFSLVGESYDFRFDFADASRQVCTEVIYRALAGKGAIQFKLVERAGHPTLSADDIVRYNLDTGGAHFEIVFYAEEDPDADDHRAKIWTGTDAGRRLAARMEEASTSHGTASAPAGAAASP